MRIREYGNFGSISSTGADCPASGSWENWCDCMFPTDTDSANNRRCRNKPFLALAPWTDIGAIQRGIPKPGSIVVTIANTVAPLKPQTLNLPSVPPIIQGNTGQDPAYTPPSNQPGAQAAASDFPFKAVAIAAGALGLGFVAFMSSGKKKSRR